MTDPYDLIHQLLREYRYEEVIDLLYVSASSKLNRSYESDENHGWYILGDIYFKKKDFQKALHFFNKALQAWGEDLDSMLAISNIYSLEGNPQKVINFLEPTVKSFIDARLTYNYANALFDLGRYEDSVWFYHKVSKSNIELHDLARNNIKSARYQISQRKAH